VMLRPGSARVGHAWAYLPDLAQTMARLVERAETLDRFEVFHFGGHWTGAGADMAQSVRHVTGRANLPVLPFPWPLLPLLAPFMETFREMLEMRYLWRTPLRLDNAKLVSVLGAEPHTPLDQAVRETLQGLGCLKTPARNGALVLA